jgi:RHS repeat-associated protein
MASPNAAIFGNCPFRSETGLYATQTRFYSSSLATFTSQDPAGAGMNLYEYCSDGPAGLWASPRMVGAPKGE